MRYETLTPPKAVSHCHCQQCRKSHGAAFASYGSVPRSDLRIQAGADNITSFESSESVSRQFCARCGSSLFWSRDHGDYSDWISIALGCLDSTFTPTKQKQTHLASTAAWYALDDRTEPVMTEDESLLAAIHEGVNLNAYEASWPQAFDDERDRLLCLFPGVFKGVQHIGSTAVPGLSAKPIIDILAGVESITIAEQLALPLCNSGYTTSSEFNDSLQDRKWFMRWENGHRTHHLHLVVHDGCVWRERLKFRDALRASPALATRYAALKAELAATHPHDREAYTAAKTDFIRTVLHEIR